MLLRGSPVSPLVFFGQPDPGCLSLSFGYRPILLKNTFSDENLASYAGCIFISYCIHAYAIVIHAWIEAHKAPQVTFSTESVDSRHVRCAPSAMRTHHSSCRANECALGSGKYPLHGARADPELTGNPQQPEALRPQCVLRAQLQLQDASDPWVFLSWFLDAAHARFRP
jgi:hypothetical protein